MNVFNPKIQLEHLRATFSPSASSEVQQRPKATLDLVWLGIPGMEGGGPQILTPGRSSSEELLLGGQALEESVGKRDLSEAALGSFLEYC